MNKITEVAIRLTSAVMKITCGWLLLDLVSETQSFLFLISGIFLMLAGLHCIVPWVLDMIQFYVVNKKTTVTKIEGDHAST